MAKILGLDLGTNSIGIAVRNTDAGNNIEQQLEYFRSVIFKSGVGTGKSGEFSYAAERTKKRTSRNCLKARKQRIWSTLNVLIDNGFCPLSKEGLLKWSRYDKAKGLKRQYPTDEPVFEQWVRLDFNNDGKQDYKNPFEIRKELTERVFNLDNQLDRYIFGRAIYHIAQHRGFKSSKGETLKEQEQKENIDTELDISVALKKSEETKSKAITEYMIQHNLKTIGQAYAMLISEGIRVRQSDFNAVRSQFKDELIYIFKYQGLDINSPFCKAILSEKKKEGTIFYKRPLRSQKGLVGKCTFEKDKPRCPISHPEYEKFRAICFVNNIKFRETPEDKWQTLTFEQKEALLNEKFYGLKRKYFKFEDIRKWIEKKTSYTLSYENKDKRTINYPDNTSVSGCPVMGSLLDLLGENWKTATISTDHERVNRKTGEIHTVTYNYEDIWHLCFQFSTSDELDKLKDVAKNTLKFDETNQVKLASLYNKIEQGYAKISLKSIRNINRFLERGIIYSHAVLLAKLPEIFGDSWSDLEDNVHQSIARLTTQHSELRQLYQIANGLISNYKSLSENQRFAFKNYNYVLDSDDFNDIKKATYNVIKKSVFEGFNSDHQEQILDEVAKLYQDFFTSKERDYYKIPRLIDFIADNLSIEYNINKELLKENLYHPSMVEFYPHSNDNLLGSPVIGAIRNPMAMRVLHTLRREINELLKTGQIDIDTHIVVETARELNDANWRWAINSYQKRRDEENKEFEKILKVYYSDKVINADDIEKTRLLIQQSKDYVETDFTNNKIPDNILKKYRLWLEQGGVCIYTGEPITISELLNSNCDVEHTIPRSISFDDSLANKTICKADFNRNIKKNKYPTQLQGVAYKDTINVYEAILERIKPWQDKVDRLKKSIKSLVEKSKFCQDKDSKDYYIRQRHLRELELEYWSKKVETFTLKEFTDSFRNNQLNDTRTITKYAYHYLRSVFNHVSVQRGSTTAEFRKILGIQSQDEKKDRSLHSHHAIDATVLTLIPTEANKKKILELFYKSKETNDNIIRKELKDKIEECNIPRISNLTDFIQKNILVKHIIKDQTLTPTHRKLRRRGKVVYQKDGETPVWITGDTIRGQLHEETFYGAIKKAKIEDGRILRDDSGKIITDDNELSFVRRYPLVDFEKKKWTDLEKVIVNKSLIPMMKRQFSEGTSLKDAIARGIYMQKYDKKTKEYIRLNKIRHIRCFANVSNPLETKMQTYKSTKDYKNTYYAASGDLPYMCKYEPSDPKKKPMFVPYNLFEISMHLKQGGIPTHLTENNIEYKLSKILKKGDILLVYKDDKSELFDLKQEDLLKRAYVVDGFEADKRMYILQINISDTNTTGKPKAIVFNDLKPYIRTSMSSLNWLTLGIDFEFKGNNIVFIDK